MWLTITPENDRMIIPWLSTSGFHLTGSLTAMVVWPWLSVISVCKILAVITLHCFHKSQLSMTVAQWLIDWRYPYLGISIFSLHRLCCWCEAFGEWPLHPSWQGSNTLLYSCLGQVDSSSGKVPLHSNLLMGKGSGRSSAN